MRFVLLVSLFCCSMFAAAQSAYFDEKVDAAVADLIITVDGSGMMKIKDANVKSLEGQDVIFNTFLGLLDDDGNEHLVGRLITKDPDKVKFMVNEFSKEMIDEKVAELVKKGALKNDNGGGAKNVEVEFVVRTSIDLYKKVARAYANTMSSGALLAHGETETFIAYRKGERESRQEKARSCTQCDSVQADNYFFAEQPQDALTSSAKIVYRIPNTNKTVIYGVSLCLGEGCQDK
ncbi:hypothetical protein SCOR_15935 [Sulfidibacter corallicola]|uniref:Uncharacterized protein n=1 Tax=Sulfidibacter corallicola TaxID=2818388 RepID=A0A8A4TX48_SULCO|nr:hypothetical protein [Sulfidibacter corallicola]QTD54043.1 hypothetical protein J3U87_16480 [Sulfidibacter corallicola]